VQQNLNILVVDDFSTMRRIIKNLLHDLGYASVSEADDGNTALPLLKSGNFNFLITDWNMPGMPGLELLKQVRADARLGNMPVLMLTAEAKRDQIVEAVQAGVNGYVIKPFTAATLKDRQDHGVARGGVNAAVHSMDRRHVAGAGRRRRAGLWRRAGRL
jgi:two-component system chemotaxis response regulator CheY